MEAVFFAAARDESCDGVVAVAVPVVLVAFTITWRLSRCRRGELSVSPSLRDVRAGLS